VSLESLFNDHRDCFIRASTGQQLFSQDETLTQGGSLDEETTFPQFAGRERKMKRACPKLFRNHSKKSKKSRMEISTDAYRQMIASNRRKPCCSLCGAEGHKARGTKCRVVSTYYSYLVITVFDETTAGHPNLQV
jgi:hypothetical protein